MPRPEAILAGIRTAILTAHDEETSLPTATAQVADYYCRRREERGASPSSVAEAGILVLRVGTALAEELAAA